jgi:hypothetical protein
MMIQDTLQVLLWITTIMLVISGIDDMYLDLLYWLLRGRYKSKFPDFSTMHYKPEKPIAIMVGAWNESKVIGRTLSYAVKNLRYKNYRIFVGIYPNDTESINVIKEFSLKDSRVIACINPRSGPTTKADNLNAMYAGLCEYEKVYGEFEIIIIHDAEDFIHPSSLKLYNFLLGYKGYHGVQIPVIPIKSKLGKIYHRTYCDAFAEIHTKDMIVRQGMGTFIPFSGTGMGFHRKAIYYLEMFYNQMKKLNSGKSFNTGETYLDPWGRQIEVSEKYFKNTEENKEMSLYYNETSYHDDPFVSLNIPEQKYVRPAKSVIRRYTTSFIVILLFSVGLLVYDGFMFDNSIHSESKGLIFQNLYAGNEQPKDILKYNSELSFSPFSKNGFSDYNYKIVYIPVEKKNIGKQDDISLIPIDNGTFDKTYNVIYTQVDYDKYGIQESVWSSREVADARLNLILEQPSLSDLSGYVTTSKKMTKTLYKVIIGKYNSLEEAQKNSKKIRDIFPN